MMDEAMVSKCTSPLLLQSIFFMMQNVGIPFQNCFTKTCNLTWNDPTNSPITKQMQHKFKLEKTKSNVLKKNWFQKLTIWMSSGLFSSATNSSNLLSISPHTSITTRAMVVVAKGWSMWREKLWIRSFDKKCNFTGGSNDRMVVTFVVVESSIV